MDEAIGLGDLMTALVAFQAECPVLTFDKVVKTKQYKFDYVSLAKMVNETKPLLAKHGLFISQNPMPCSREDHVRIKTILGHKSGQYMSSEYEMKIPMKGQTISPQDVGSAISYAKRYAYGAILSLITDDDQDGHSPSEVYTGSPDDTAWLKQTCEKMGYTDKAVMREVHEKLLKGTHVKDAKVVSDLIA